MPVCPTCVAYGYHPASTTARVAATAPPSACASSSTSVKFSGAAEAAAAGDDHVGVLDRRALALGVRLLDHRRAEREVLELDVDVLDLGLAARLLRVEGARTDQRQPRLARPADVDVDGVAERRPLPDQAPVLLDEVDEVPVEPGVEPGGEPGGDVGREHGRGEEDGVEPWSRTSAASASTRGCGSGCSSSGLSAT